MTLNLTCSVRHGPCKSGILGIALSTLMTLRKPSWIRQAEDKSIANGPAARLQRGHGKACIITTFLTESRWLNLKSG